MVTAVQPQMPVPQANETEEDFIVRSHYALASALPDPGQRNRVIWQAWDNSRGNEMYARAAQYFGAEQYSPTEPRPFFMEHEKVNYGPDGSEQITNYDLSELTKIVRENNHRIQDTDAYTALVDKHTLPPPYRDPDPPKNLGFVGPYRLGMVGRKNPRWGIFANEWQRTDKADQLRDRPNRSVEVLQLKANGRRYIDPIAALSEAPRLPLPTTAQYAADSDSEAITVERYDATTAIASFPGGTNTRPKTTKKGKKDMYGSAPVDQDMIREVLNALMSTEEWQTISNAAAMIGDDQPVNTGQDELGDMPMDDPMAGGMPEPPMPEGGEPMGDPMMGDPMMDEPMEEEYVQEDVEDAPMPEQNGIGQMAGTAAMQGMHANKMMNNVSGAALKKGVDRNAAPAIAAAAGRAAAGTAARAAGGTAARAAGGQATKGGMRKAAKEIGTDMATDAVANKLSNVGGGGGQQEQKPGILARILAGPGAQDAAAAPPAQFGATKGYHRYSTNLEDNSMRRDQYAALTAENQQMRTELNELKKHNDSLLTEQAQMYAATQHEVVQLRQNAIDAERKERLTHLANQYSAVNLKNEMDECLYQNGSEMSNDDFNKRIELIQQYAAASAPASPMIPLGYDGSLANGDVNSDKFAAQVADKALELVNAGIKTGKRLSYQEAVTQAKTELSE